MSAPVKVIWPNVERPIVYITRAAKDKLDAYINAAQGEISGMGTVFMLGPNRFLIKEIFIFKQKANAVKVELDKKDMSDFMIKWISEGKDLSTVRLQWHSHADMDVFWSEDTDLPNIESFDNGTADWMISMVGNKSGEYLCRVDVYKPLRVYFDNLPLTVYNPINEVVLKACVLEVAQKVSEFPPEPVQIYKSHVTYRRKVRRYRRPQCRV